MRLDSYEVFKLFARHRGSIGHVGLTLGLAVFSRLAQLGVMIVVARMLGPSDYGLYIFATGAAVIGGMIGCLGWQMSFNRFFALTRRESDLGALHGLMRAADRVVLVGTLGVALALLAASRFEGKLAWGFVAAAALTVPMGFTFLRRQQLAGVGRAPAAMMLDQGFASIVLFVAVMLADLTLVEMVATYGVALGVGVVTASALVNRGLPAGTNSAAPRYDTRMWMRTSATLMLAQSASMLLSRLDVLLLPTLANLHEAGLYGAALRVTMVLTFPQFVLQTLTGPKFAEAFAEERHGQARKILIASLAFALLTALPLLAVFVIAPQWTMTSLFGPAYAAGALPLVLVALGQVAIGLTVPFDAVLRMSGREVYLVRLNLGVLVATVLVSLVLIPAYGAVGGGMVTLLSGAALLIGQSTLGLRAIRNQRG